MRHNRPAPIRVRLTTASLLGLLIVITGLSWFVYVRTNGNILGTVDAGLRSRSEVLASEVRKHGPALPTVRPTLIERDEGFAQLTDAAGNVIDSSAIVSGTSLVSPATLAGLTEAAFFDERVPGIDNVTRVLAAPVEASGTRYVLVVGTSLQDRRDEVLQLAATLAVTGGVLLLFVGSGAWWLIGAALEPVERMRRQAERITTAEPDARLAVAGGSDEIARLGSTLNAMLDRIEAVVERERQLVDRASHELRTPLAIQRMALDLASSGPQTIEELASALRSASEENGHLTRIADDLLVLSRARGGALPIHARDVSLATLVRDAIERNRPRAEDAGVRLSGGAADAVVHLDPDWIRQALHDLLDNAIRVTPSGGEVRVHAVVDTRSITLTVDDDGTGFDEHFLERAFDPFTSGASSRDGRGAGLGLTIVRAIAEAHEGTVEAANTHTGARITIRIPQMAAKVSPPSPAPDRR